jgi:DNA-binding MarR family transcriptional regulator
MRTTAALQPVRNPAQETARPARFEFRMVVEFGSVDEERSRMVRDELSVMSAFLAVADERSFTSAAKRLGVTQSALSHAIRGLEEQVGVRLLARTTRSVAPSDAGEQLIAELRPALTGIRAALGRIGGLRDSPRGRVRLVVAPASAAMVVGPKLAEFAHHYPDLMLEVTLQIACISTSAPEVSMPASISASSSSAT